MAYERERDSLDFGLLANFVHQVINPLNGVCGTLDNLANGSVPEHKREQKTRQARAQLEHSILLVRNLAYFSQISLDPRNTNAGAVAKTCVIPQVIIEAILYFQETAKSKDMAIDLLDKWTQYRVEGNPDLLRQVFMNLFDNAVKYGDRGTKVEIKPWVQAKTGTLIISVTSHGPPVPASERDNIFKLGFRGSHAKARVASGTGLGLHICRVIIEEVHKGSIILEASPAQGTNTFMLRFPEFTIGAPRT
jgi:signal transduction histidine kinase